MHLKQTGFSSIQSLLTIGDNHYETLRYGHKLLKIEDTDKKYLMKLIRSIAAQNSMIPEYGVSPLVSIDGMFQVKGMK